LSVRVFFFRCRFEKQATRSEFDPTFGGDPSMYADTSSSSSSSRVGSKGVSDSANSCNDWDMLRPRVPWETPNPRGDQHEYSDCGSGYGGSYGGSSGGNGCIDNDDNAAAPDNASRCVFVEVDEASRTVFKQWRSAEFSGCDLYFFGPPCAERGGGCVVVRQQCAVQETRLPSYASSAAPARRASARYSASSPASNSVCRRKSRRGGASAADAEDAAEDALGRSPGRSSGPWWFETPEEDASSASCPGIVRVTGGDDGGDNDNEYNGGGAESSAGGSVYSEFGEHIMDSSGTSWREDEAAYGEKDSEAEATGAWALRDLGRPAPESPGRVRRETEAATEAARSSGGRGRVGGGRLGGARDGTATGDGGEVGGYLGTAVSAAAAFRRLSPAEDRADRVADAVGR
jgi:hypothetical protein